VLSVMTFTDEDEALAMANRTEYGLAAGVWTRDIGRRTDWRGSLQAGTVWINTYHPGDAASPFGGYKQSGFGRELGGTRWTSTPRSRACGSTSTEVGRTAPSLLMRHAWIIDAVRTPIGRHGGALAGVRPDDLAAVAVRSIVERTGIDPAAGGRRHARLREPGG
jgi:delta 1-pyrroline-5-carboxylate dehydrogenase